MTNTVTPKETAGSFINKVLGGTATAIVVALIPNAILATFLKPFLSYGLAAEFLHIVQVFQFFTPIMAGFLIGQQFKFTPMQQLAVEVLHILVLVRGLTQKLFKKELLLVVSNCVGLVISSI
ncbi:PTS sugar transporter subunit IIC [Streptococcus agalactiae]|uniref:PTS sugar transporter subunit IIC n=1 Tax=Streptococcus agalactiae TaxID=1311 RepID=UPI00346459D7